MMPHTSRHTMVARYEGQRVVGQFYITPDAHNAQLVYLAPHLPADNADSAWLLMLDAMVREAGRRGAHNLIAELNEDSPLFTTLRRSGFAVYARQQLWATSGEIDAPPAPVRLIPASESDGLHIQLVYQRTVPSLLQQATPSPQPEGYLYLEDGQAMGFISVTDGRDGVYVVPFLDARMQANPADVLHTALAQLSPTEKRPVAVRVRRHQGWLHSRLEDIGLTVVAHQAVMIRHIAAGVHSPGFASLNHRLAKGHLPRQTDRVPEVCINTTPPLAPLIGVNWTPFGSRETCDGRPAGFLSGTSFVQTEACRDET